MLAPQLVNSLRAQLRLAELHLRVDLDERDLAADRIKRYDVVAFVVDAIDPLFWVLLGVVFDAHLVLIDEEHLFDGGNGEKTLELSHPLGRTRRYRRYDLDNKGGIL